MKINCDRKGHQMTHYAKNVEKFFEKFSFSPTEILKSVITTVKGIELTVPERRK